MPRWVGRLLSALEAVAAAVSAATLFGVMGIVAADVAMRYLAGRPFLWSHDLVSFYLLPAVFYLALAKTFEIHGHIGVDILQYSLPERGRRLCQVAIGLLSALLFGLIATLGLLRAVEEWRDDIVTAGLIEWPTWVSAVMVPVGAGLATLRLVVHALRHALALGGGEGALDLPPLAGAEHSLLGPEP